MLDVIFLDAATGETGVDPVLETVPGGEYVPLRRAVMKDTDVVGNGTITKLVEVMVRIDVEFVYSETVPVEAVIGPPIDDLDAPAAV